MQQVEHEALLEQLSAYAFLDVEIHLMQDDREDQEVQSTRFAKVIAVGINNRQGKKAATNVLVNVVAPTHAKLSWSDANGGPHPTRSGSLSPTSEKLRAGDESFDSHYVDHTIPTISTSADGAMLYVRADLELGTTHALDPSQHGPTELLLPVKVDVSSDDLPEARRKIVVERGWRFWRAPIQA
jgi:hypothetical protein